MREFAATVALSDVAVTVRRVGGAMAIIAGAVTLALAGLFAVSGLQKARDVKAFAVALGKYRLVPRQTLTAVSIAVPTVEFVLAAWLVSTRGSPWPLVAAGTVLVGFTAAVLTRPFHGVA